MGKRPVPDVVQHNGCHRGFGFGLADLVAFEPQLAYGFAGQMHGSRDVLKTAMPGTRVHQAGQPQLLYPAQTIEVRMLVHLVEEACGEIDKPKNRIVYYFLFHSHIAFR